MKTALTLIALLITKLATAAAPIDGWYSSVFGGYAYLPNNLNRTVLGLQWDNASYRSGYDAGVNFGFKSNPMRYEGELTYVNANVNNFNINGIRQLPRSGYSNAVLAMANIYYDFPDCVAQGVQPYLGFGIGYAWVHANLTAIGPVVDSRFSAYNSVFTYQPTAGVTYNFAENWAFTLGYRYAVTDRASNLGKRFQANLANLGVVYRFNECCYQ